MIYYNNQNTNISHGKHGKISHICDTLIMIHEFKILVGFVDLKSRHNANLNLMIVIK